VSRISLSCLKDKLILAYCKSFMLCVIQLYRLSLVYESTIAECQYSGNGGGAEK